VNRKCSKLRLYPAKAQARKLNESLETCRQVYNSLVNDRKCQYELHGVSVSRFDQQAYLPIWKKSHPELGKVHSQVLQDVVHRVSLAFDAFFDRVKKGEAPGFPRLKGDGYDSLTYTQVEGFDVFDNSIRLSKIGVVKAKIHRTLKGAVKNCTVRRRNGKWFACLCYEVEPEPLPRSEEAVGIDVGLKTFAAFSNGEMIDNPRFFRRDEAALAKAQRKHAKNQKRTKASQRSKKVIARVHERIRNRRHDFCHQASRRIVNRYGVIAIENLNVRNMTAAPKAKPDPENEGRFLPNGARRKAGLNKSIADAAWSQFHSTLAQKAESAAREVHQVNPAYTSQDCSSCGYRPDGLEGRTRKKLSDRWHWCPLCGLSVDRDTNAAVNVLKLALGQQCVAPVRA
jgi:putative transposase